MVANPCASPTALIGARDQKKGGSQIPSQGNKNNGGIDPLNFYSGGMEAAPALEEEEDVAKKGSSKEGVAMDASEEDVAKGAATIADYEAIADGFHQGNLNHDVSQNLEALLQALGGRPGLDILDLGCAGGRDLVALTKRGHRAVGLEGGSRFCQLARATSGCEVLQQNLCELQLPAEAYDGIFANAVLFHVPSTALPMVLEGLHRALRPGGVLFSSNAHGFGEDREGWTDGRTPGNSSWVCWMSEASWTSTMQDAGFELLDLYYRPPGKPREQQPFLATVWRKA